MHNKLNNKKFAAQDNLYEFPYHYLPEKISNEVIKPFRVKYWLFDYLNLIEYFESFFTFSK